MKIKIENEWYQATNKSYRDTHPKAGQSYIACTVAQEMGVRTFKAKGIHDTDEGQQVKVIGIDVAQGFELMFKPYEARETETE